VRGFTLRSGLAVVIALTMQTGVAGAQIIRRPIGGPTAPNWIGGGVAISNAFILRDGVTNSDWAFDGGLGYTASFEHPTQGGMMIGVQGTYATPSMIYTSSTGAVNCAGGCPATGTVMQIMGLIHSPNSYSFHGAYQLTVGATGFSSFRDQASNSQLGPKGTDYDFSFAIGYGLGVGVSSRIAVEVMQEIGTVLHQRTGLTAGSGNYPRMFATKLVGKIAF
jgi:hypothetical protein